MKSTKIIIAIGLATIIILAGFLILKQTPEEQIKEGCGEGTTIYKNENLCWQKSTKIGRTSSWEDAKNYCDNLILGEEDNWRLPTLTELQELVEVKGSDVSINTSVFTDTEKIHYWTSTPFSSKENFHWYVHFDIGEQGYAPDFKENYGVRCVRDNSLL